MPTSSIDVTEGDGGKKLATSSISEDAETKEISRISIDERDGTDVGLSAKLGGVTETAPATDTASSGLNGRLQRIAQRLTSVLAKLPALGTAGSASADVITVQGVSSMTKILTTPDLPTGASTGAKQDTGNTSLGNIDTNAGATSDAAVAAGATGSIAAKLRSISRDLIANIVLAAGTNKIGDVDIAPRTTGGWSVGNFTSGDSFTALTNSAQVVKASAGKFGGYYIYNPNPVAIYVMLYNVAQGSVTVGTTNPKLVFAIPAYSAANLEILAGISFDTAITIAAATTGGGNGAPTTALECLIWYV